jgi:hypothetical protein
LQRRFSQRPLCQAQPIDRDADPSRSAKLGAGDSSAIRPPSPILPQTKTGRLGSEGAGFAGQPFSMGRPDGHFADGVSYANIRRSSTSIASGNPRSVQGRSST